MKTIQILFFVALGTVLMAADCSNKDSEFYNDVFATASNLVTIERSDIPEDQTIYVKATIPRVLTVDNMVNQLDIYKTTGGAVKMDFSYEVEKQTNGVWDYIEIANDQVATTKGETEVDYFVLAKAKYDVSTQTYEFHSGLQNLPAGSYRLSFGYNSNVNNIVEMRSESVNNNLFLNLNSPTTDLDNAGYYYFTIN